MKYNLLAWFSCSRNKTGLLSLDTAGSECGSQMGGGTLCSHASSASIRFQ